MDRPKRAIKAPVRLIAEDDKPVKEVAKPVNKRQPKNATQQPAEQLQVSERIATKTPSAPAKTKKTEGRTLNLDLPKKNAQRRQKIYIRLEFAWPTILEDNFYTPQDNITQEYMEATEKLNNLPSSFVLMRGIETAFGVANLELNPDLVKSSEGSELRQNESSCFLMKLF
jgi:hypothetical protein